MGELGSRMWNGLRHSSGHGLPQAREPDHELPIQKRPPSNRLAFACLPACLPYPAPWPLSHPHPSPSSYPPTPLHSTPAPSRGQAWHFQRFRRRGTLFFDGPPPSLALHSSVHPPSTLPRHLLHITPPHPTLYHPTPLHSTPYHPCHHLPPPGLASLTSLQTRSPPPLKGSPSHSWTPLPLLRACSTSAPRRTCARATGRRCTPRARR